MGRRGAGEDGCILRHGEGGRRCSRGHHGRSCRGGSLELTAADKGINAGALRLSTPVRSPSPPTTMASTPTVPSASATALSASLPATITGGKVNVDKPEEALEGGLVTVTSRRGDAHRH
ncbi:MAG: hypothetical protein SPK00_01485 [Corynebacterium glucuronolyticum]|nr:hypothetical protein [Mycobacteriaceae bacterium]MDY5833414.1 hypothetical protein [Corynebacterium glucuronolyticum]